MIDFVSIATHSAVAYLHALLAFRFYGGRRVSLALHLFWFLMVMFALLHSLYVLRIVSELYGWMFVAVASSILASCLLLFTPPLLAPTLFSELNRLPVRFNAFARCLRPVATYISATVTVAFVISVSLAVWIISSANTYTLDNNFVSLGYAASTFGLWMVMIAVGLRYDETKTSDLAKPTAILFGLLMVFYGVTVFVVNLGEFWGLIPVVSTVSFSLLLSWIRFRLQFIDVILRQCVVFVLVVTAVSVGYLVMEEFRDQPLAAFLLILFGYCAAAALVTRTAVAAFKRIWVPSTKVLATIHDTLPARLAACTDRAAAIAATEVFLNETFHADVAIDRSLDRGVQHLTIPGSPDLALHLGYINNWMPWFSDAVHWVRTAGLYLQGHLQVLSALEQMHAQALETQTLSKLATKAELSAMRARIRPHFLFNTLNAIHSFVREDPVAAERTIELLAELMRGAAQGRDTDLCPLASELQLSRTYLEIEKMRYGDRLRFDIRCDESFNEIQVPTFSIQPLIENAVKYSVEGQLEAGEVDVEVLGEGDDVVIRVRDNGVGLQNGSLKGLGMAVENVRERLQRLFGENAALILEERAGGGVEACLRIPAAGL
jgi:signal transduction histidine kinase